jgi:hypothetical protein
VVAGWPQRGIVSVVILVGCVASVSAVRVAWPKHIPGIVLASPG